MYLYSVSSSFDTHLFSLAAVAKSYLLPLIALMIETRGALEPLLGSVGCGEELDS